MSSSEKCGRLYVISCSMVVEAVSVQLEVVTVQCGEKLRKPWLVTTVGFSPLQLTIMLTGILVYKYRRVGSNKYSNSLGWSS